MNRGGRRGNFGLIMLGMQVMRFGYDRIPPCTLTLLITCVVTSLGIVPAEFWAALGIHAETDLMLVPARVIYNLELYRLATSLVYHGQDWHLYYNMTSLLWKGSALERVVGTKRCMVLTVILGALAQLLFVAVCYLRWTVLEQPDAMRVALSGFSGVLFAYKVLITWGAPAEHMSALMGILPLQTRYVVWGELLLMHFLFPNSSFVAHLCGILAGLMVCMGWFDSIIQLADMLPDINLNGGNGRFQEFNNQGQARAPAVDEWQAQPPPQAAAPQHAPEAFYMNAEDDVEEEIPRAPLTREEMRQRALAAAEARRRR